MKLRRLIKTNFLKSDLDRYEHLIKHFDQQLQSQLKDRDYVIQKIELEGDAKDDKFLDRITKIEAQGLSRNRVYFEFDDYKKEFQEVKTWFENEISLALTDGLVSDIGNLK